jgi:F-box-like
VTQSQSGCSKQAQYEIPPEVFYFIFSSSIGDSETLIQEKLASLEALCLVCRRWRDMVYGEPRLWKGAKVCWDDSPELPSLPVIDSRAATLRRFYSRSGTMPLTVHLQWMEYKGCAAQEPMQSIASFDRWETVSIQFDGKGDETDKDGIEYRLSQAFTYMKDGHSYFRSVRKFSLRDHGNWTSGTDAARLLKLMEPFPNITDSEVEIYGMTSSVRLPSYMAKLNRLRLCASIWDPEIPPVLSLILATAPQLEYLAYHATYIYPDQLWKTLSKPRPVVHANLKHLSIACTCTAWLQLQIITCPSLHTLELSDNGTEPSLRYFCPWEKNTTAWITAAISTMVAQSKCTIHHLSLKGLPLNDSDLCDLLRGLPSLRSLSLQILIYPQDHEYPNRLTRPDSEAVNRFLEALLESSISFPIAPNLESITVDIERGKEHTGTYVSVEGINPEAFIAFAEGRQCRVDWNQGEVTARLKDAALIVNNDVVYSRPAAIGRMVIEEREEKAKRWTNEYDKDACVLM